MANTNGEDTRRVDHEDLREFSERVLQAAGVADEHAAIVAEALVRASLRGIDSHGVARLEVYAKKFEGGGFNPDPDITVTEAGDALRLVDADDGPGQSAGLVAMDAAMEAATECGVGWSFVRNSNHFGTGAYYTQRAAEEGYVGFGTTNVGSDVVPFGGAEATLGTNPISFSIPTDRSFPVTLDMATSVVAMGTIDHVAATEDDAIPDHCALDADGEPTTDPHAVSALRPVGGPKGYGLAMVVDVLAGILTDTNPSYGVGPLYDEFDRPMRLGHCMAAIDVSALRDPDQFREEVGEYVDRLKAVPTREGFDEVKVPGEIEAETRRRNEAEGIPLRDGTVESLRRLEDRYAVELPAGV
jgi:ureidoglycolate dehydrogenase (NAD+)